MLVIVVLLYIIYRQSRAHCLANASDVCVGVVTMIEAYWNM